jgi:hypothetical protein
MGKKGNEKRGPSFISESFFYVRGDHLKRIIILRIQSIYKYRLPV